MGLVFQRLACNFIKNGYFPNNGDTTERVLSALSLVHEVGGATLRILDFCCGEGTALAEVRAHRQGLECTEACDAYGLEYDVVRAYHAKSLLQRTVHADLMNVSACLSRTTRC